MIARGFRNPICISSEEHDKPLNYYCQPWSENKDGSLINGGGSLSSRFKQAKDLNTMNQCLQYFEVHEIVELL